MYRVPGSRCKAPDTVKTWQRYAPDSRGGWVPVLSEVKMQRADRVSLSSKIFKLIDKEQKQRSEQNGFRDYDGPGPRCPPDGPRNIQEAPRGLQEDHEDTQI
eukprot:9494250-Pyramimonas_sp.AAC.1